VVLFLGLFTRKSNNIIGIKSTKYGGMSDAIPSPSSIFGAGKYSEPGGA
jgi:hypothetical protein